MTGRLIFVFHLGAIADVNVATVNPTLCLQINEIGTLNLLKAASATEIERIILASTTWVYGKTKGEVDENTPIPPPDHIYTKTKIGQEHLLAAYHEHTGLTYTILRYDIPYGPRMRSNLVMSIFVRKAMQIEPITVFGDGNQGRCFIYVEDLAEGNVAALKQTACNQIFNLAGSDFVTINRIVECLRSEFDLKLEHLPPRPNDFLGVTVNIDKARKQLGWEPKTKFDTGLRKYIRYVQNEERQG
jgi:UDP-glucose 4-epimerase